MYAPGRNSEEYICALATRHRGFTRALFQEHFWIWRPCKAVTSPQCKASPSSVRSPWIGYHRSSSSTSRQPICQVLVSVGPLALQVADGPFANTEPYIPSLDHRTCTLLLRCLKGGLRWVNTLRCPTASTAIHR